MNYTSYFQNKVIWITGASSGIGEELAIQLARAGAKLILSARNEEKLHDLQQKIENHNQHSVVPLDLANLSNLTELTSEILEIYGRIDILINNAGITQDARLVKMTEAQFDTVIDVNLKGVFNCTQLIVPHMLEAGSGAVVNASSVVGLYGNFGQTNYSATKFGVIGFTKTWARELGPKGIRVNAVCPGFIATEMVKAMPENILQDIEKRSWLGRLGTPTEMANVYLFLASDEASYVNGVALEASGGISL